MSKEHNSTVSTISTITKEITTLQLIQDISFYDLVKDSIEKAAAFREPAPTSLANENLLNSWKQTEISKKKQSPFSLSVSNSMTPRAAFKAKALVIPSSQNSNKLETSENIVNTHFKKQPDYRHTDVPKTKRKLYIGPVEEIKEDIAQEHAPSTNRSHYQKEIGYDLADTKNNEKVMLPFNLAENQHIGRLLVSLSVYNVF